MVIKKYPPVKSLIRTGLFVTAALATTPPAHAGFDWTPPAKREQAAPPVAAAPAPVVDMAPIGTPLPEIDAFPAGGGIPSGIVEAVPLLASQQDQDSSSYETVNGFGADIPLVLMLNQIVPSGYSYAFDEGVNPGGLVSWNGGRPWNEILEDSLQAKGMYAVIAGRNVRVATGPKPMTEETMMAQETPSAPAETTRPREILPLAGQFETPSFPSPTPEITESGGDETIPQSYPRRVRPDKAMETPREAIEEFPQPLFPEESGEQDLYAPTSLTPPPLRREEDISAASDPATHPSFEMPAPEKSAARAMDPFEIGFWHAEQGESLKTVLEKWSSMAGVAMLWNAQSDYLLSSPVRMHGTFPDAVTSVLTSFSNVSPRPLGKLHPNLPDGPSVLVIQEK